MPPLSRECLGVDRAMGGVSVSAHRPSVGANRRRAIRAIRHLVLGRSHSRRRRGARRPYGLLGGLERRPAVWKPACRESYLRRVRRTNRLVRPRYPMPRHLSQHPSCVVSSKREPHRGRPIPASRFLPAQQDYQDYALPKIDTQIDLNSCPGGNFPSRSSYEKRSLPTRKPCST